MGRHLMAMDFDKPAHRPILEMEGLRKWVLPRMDGYASLFEAVKEQTDHTDMVSSNLVLDLVESMIVVPLGQTVNGASAPAPTSRANGHSSRRGAFVPATSYSR